MKGAQTTEITGLLQAWTRGDQETLNQLDPLVYSELHRMAKGYMRRERAGLTLQTTALAYETHLRLVHETNVEWRDRAHFFAVSAQMMRRILVDLARERGSFKRGGRATRMDFDRIPEISLERARELVAVDESLKKLEEMD